MDQKLIFLIILGMALATYIPRLLPLLLLTTRDLPPVVFRWLSYIPAAVLAAMLFPSLFVKEENVDFGPDNIFLWAAVPTLLVAWKTKSLFASVVTGMIMVAAWRYFV